jgi:predicted aspartyl protease
VLVAAPGAITPSNPPTQATAFQALIDTGASGSCISPAVAQAVGLQPKGKRPMVSVTHAVPGNWYLADLIIPFGQIAIPVPGIEVMEFSAAGNSAYQILIGRDIICRGTFAMSFDGHFSLSL